MVINEEMVNELYSVIADIRTPEECKLLFEDLCTYKEIEQMAQRLKSAELLLEGDTYANVIEHTGISSATLSRVSRCVQIGSGGYKMAIDRKKSEQ